VGQEPRNSASGCLFHFTGRALGLQTAAATRLKCPDAETRVETQAQASDCESGGIGRRARLRIWCRKAWGFESPLSHCLSFGPCFVVRARDGKVAGTETRPSLQASYPSQSPEQYLFASYLTGQKSQVTLAFFGAVN
jgi:hypothetical protein